MYRFSSSSRVGGRVITFRDSYFAPGLHGEGGAMRIPKDHFLILKYITNFGLEKQLFDFEMKNKFIYLSGLGKTVTYDEFDKMLKQPDSELTKVFPNLKSNEKGKTCDKLFEEATEPVVIDFWKAYGEWRGAPASNDKSDSQAGYSSQKAQATTEDPKRDRGGGIRHAYAAITKKYDKYSLRSYLTEVAGWSQDAINLYDLGNAHVVFENGFIESLKDAFLSGNSSGAQAGMKQLGDGMDQVPKAFIRSKAVDANSLIDNITFGARVKHIEKGRQTRLRSNSHEGTLRDPCRRGGSRYSQLPHPCHSLHLTTLYHKVAPFCTKAGNGHSPGPLC